MSIVRNAARPKNIAVDNARLNIPAARLFERIAAGGRERAETKARRVLQKYAGAAGDEEEKYRIYFLSPETGKRIEYLGDLPLEEAEQRVCALRLLKLYPFLEKQEKEKGREPEIKIQWVDEADSLVLTAPRECAAPPDGVFIKEVMFLKKTNSGK
jgi:hypothetical protein